MKKHYLIYLFCLGIFGSSCSGVKNMSGTLSKSDSRSGTDYSKHGDYSNVSSTARYDTARYQPVTQYQPSTGLASNPRNADVYRKDYGRLTDTRSDNGQASVIPNSVQEYNQKMVNQYAEMDRLADVILYELDIIDRRWNLLLEQFRSAGNQDRELISRDLDKLNADQLTLYKNYTKIYKSGKTEWSRVKNDVETALMNMRALEKK